MAGPIVTGVLTLIVSTKRTWLGSAHATAIQVGVRGKLRLLRSQLARGLFALAALVALGIAGYMEIEGWSLFDSAYMVVVTFTTVGYEEVHPLSQGRTPPHHVRDGGRCRGDALHPDERGAHGCGAGSPAKLGPGGDRMRTRMAETQRPLHRMRLWTRRQGRRLHPAGGVGAPDRDRQGRGRRSPMPKTMGCSASTATRPGTPTCSHCPRRGGASASWPRPATTQRTST